MKKKNLKPMIISALLAIGFGATSVGTSFALFTDHAETKIDVTAGIVDIETKIELVGYSSSVEGGTVTDLTNKNTHTNELTGSNFSLNGKTVTIDRMVPGDKLVVKVTNTNKSNVITQTRFVANHATLNNKKDLFPALDINMEAKKANNDPIAYPMKWAVTPAAQNLTDGEVINTILVSIEFTDTDNGVINFNSADNAYQDAACTITFSEEAIQGNAVLNPIEVINAYLVSEDMQGRGNDTMHDALEDVAALGYEVAVLDGYVWGVNEDQFVLASGVSTNKHEYFKMVTTAAQADGFSIYAANGWATAIVAVQGIGFDAGDASGITSVTYTGLGQENPRTNIIRTNSLNTNVTVNAQYDVVKHYGDAASVNVVAVAGNSYHEYGRVAFFEVANGRVALEKTATVDNMHFTKTNDAFNEITVAYDQAVTLPKFSRDPVTTIQEGGTLVVELQNSTDKDEAESDYIWLYQQGLVEQIRISDNGTNAGNVKATDSSVSQETNKAANDIANNLKDGASTPTQEQLDTGTVPAADIEEGGLDTEGKAKAKEDALDNLAYVKNIATGAVYADFESAVKELDNGGELELVKNVNINKMIVIRHDTVTGYRIKIIVPAGKTLSFSDSGQIVFDVTSSSCRLELKGTGTISSTTNIPMFKSGYNYIETISTAHPGEMNMQCNEVIEASEITVSGGKFTDCKVRFDSGHYDTDLSCVNKEYSIINGGTYTNEPTGISLKSNYSLVYNEQNHYYELVEAVPAKAIFKLIPEDSSIEGTYILSNGFDKLQEAPYNNCAYTLELVGNKNFFIDDPINEYWMTVQFCGATNKTIDLKGFALGFVGKDNGEGGRAYDFGLIRNESGSNLTIKNGTIMYYYNRYNAGTPASLSEANHGTINVLSDVTLTNVTWTN